MFRIAHGHTRKLRAVIHNVNGNLRLVGKISLEKYRELEAENQDGDDEDDDPETALRDGLCEYRP